MGGLEKIPPKKQVGLVPSFQKKAVKSKKLKQIEGKAAGKVGERTTETEAERKNKALKQYTKSIYSGMGVEEHSEPHPKTKYNSPFAPYDPE